MPHHSFGPEGPFEEINTSYRPPSPLSHRNSGALHVKISILYITNFIVH